MKQFIAFVQKEFYHILRDKRTLLVLFGMPVAQILLFGFALSNEVKNTTVVLLDQSRDAMSKQLVDEIQASKYFDLVQEIDHPGEIDQILKRGDAKMGIIIPTDFANQLAHTNNATIQLITDGTNPNLATTFVNYLSAIVQDFQNRVFQYDRLPYEVKVTTRMLYNPQLVGAYNYVPGVIALILALVCTMMTSVSIVKEKELGNMEILLVSPMHPLMVIFSKAIPYLVLSLLILTTILILSVTILGVPIRGNLLLLYGISFLFIITMLALGLVISSITDSQQVAMLVSLMGMLLPTLLFSGFMFPIENMPTILQYISNIVPAKWYFYSIQSVMIKGLGIASLTKEIFILIGFVILFLVISFKKFNIRLA